MNKYEQIAADYLYNAEKINFKTLGEFLEANAWRIYDAYDKQCKRADILQELDERGIDYTKRDVDYILEKYETLLEDYSDWREWLNLAIRDYFGGAKNAD